MNLIFKDENGKIFPVQYATGCLYDCEGKEIKIPEDSQIVIGNNSFEFLNESKSETSQNQN